MPYAPRRDRLPAVLSTARDAGGNAGRRDAGRTDDLQRTLADLAALVGSVTLAVHELGRVGRRLRGAADDLGHALGDAWDIARAHGGGAFRAVDGTLFRRPYVAIGAAVALGALAGLVISRARGSRGRHVVADDDGWDHFV